MRGGARKGAGRQPGSTKQTASFKFEKTTLARLCDCVPRGKRAPFVEQALLRALRKLKVGQQITE
jgi:hypothetical protein